MTETAECKHDLRAINTDVPGAPPETKEEPAWCRVCGALWSKRPFGLGWGFMHHLRNTDAPTVLNLMREVGRGKTTLD